MSWRDRRWADQGANFVPEGKPLYTLWIAGVTAGFLLLVWMVGGGRPGIGELTTSIYDVLDLKLSTWWQPWRYLTYGLLHGSFGHLIGNLFMIVLAGWIMENYFGRRTFLTIFLVLLAVSGLGYFVQALIEGADPGCIGNSGAAVGLIVILGTRFPKMTVHVWGIIPVQCWLLAAIVVAIDLFMVAGRTTGGVAVGVHLVGAALGFAIGFLGPRLEGWREEATVARTRRREAKERAQVAEEQGELDRLLDKINREGMDKLTEAERKFLLSQSAKLKDGGRR